MEGILAGSNYSFVDGTFHFFQVFGRRPGTTLGLMAWHMIAYGVILAGAVLAFAPLFPFIAEAVQYEREPEAAEILLLIGSIWLNLSLFYVATFAILLMVQAAWLRLLTHGRTAAVIPFRFGADELRLLGVNLVFFLLGNLALLLVAVVIASASGIGAVAGGSEAGAALGGGLAILLVIVAIPLALIIAVRFAAAPAMTINEGGFRLFSSVRATAKFWGWMLLSYVIIYFILTMASSFLFSFMFAFGVFGVFDFAQAAEALPAGSDGLEYLGLLARPLPLISLGLILLFALLYQVVAEAVWHSVGAYSALVHEAKEAQGPEIVVPTQSVGDAPAEG